MKHTINNSRLPVFTKRFRELQGTRSNTEFAEFLNISRQTVGFYCNGERLPDAASLKNIAEKCDVSTDYLLGLSDVRSTKPEIKDVCRYTGLSERAVEKLSHDMFHREESQHLVPIMDYLIYKSGLSFLAIHLWKTLVNDAVVQETLKNKEKLKDVVSDTSRFEKWKFISACEELYDYAKNDLSAVINVDAQQELRSRVIQHIERATNTIHFAQAFVEECKREENK